MNVTIYRYIKCFGFSWHKSIIYILIDSQYILIYYTLLHEYKYKYAFNMNTQYLLSYYIIYLMYS